MLDGAVYYSFGYSGGGTTIEVVLNNLNDATPIVGYAWLSSSYSWDAAFEYGLVPAQ
jgi:hypothetical protein